MAPAEEPKAAEAGALEVAEVVAEASEVFSAAVVLGRGGGVAGLVHRNGDVDGIGLSAAAGLAGGQGDAVDGGAVGLVVDVDALRGGDGGRDAIGGGEGL